MEEEEWGYTLEAVMSSSFSRPTDLPDCLYTKCIIPQPVSFSWVIEMTPCTLVTGSPSDISFTCFGIGPGYTVNG